ncbi:MAG: prepilin-type N-terminal cleavage/methylation domain-containing protein [Chthoniobacterales bacterium]
MNSSTSPIKSPHYTCAFTLIELLVVVSIIAILIVLALPVIGTIKEKSLQTKCINNLKTWGIAITTYSQENNGKIQWKNWQSISSNTRYYNPYFGTEAIVTAKGVRKPQEYFRWCPTQEWTGGNAPVGYAFVRPSQQIKKGYYYTPGENYNIRKAAHPSQLLWMIDCTSMNISSPDHIKKNMLPLCTGVEENEDKRTIRHRGQVNALFADGHVSSYGAASLDLENAEAKKC